MMVPDLTTILDDLSILPDWESRYGYVIDLARQLPPMPEALKTQASKVRGCTSQVWLVSHWDGQGATAHLSLQLDSDALIVKGLLALVYAAYAGKTATEVIAFDLPGALTASGLLQNLSPNRRNGFASVVTRVRQLAHATD